MTPWICPNVVFKLELLFIMHVKYALFVAIKALDKWVYVKLGI